MCWVCWGVLGYVLCVSGSDLARVKSEVFVGGEVGCGWQE